MATWQGMTWQRELYGPGLEAYDPYAPVRSSRPTAPLAPLPPAVQPVSQPAIQAGPSRTDQATRLAQDIAYGHSDWERAGQAILGSGKFEEASGLRRAGAVLGGAALGTLAVASWIPGFNVFKPAQAARAARAFGQGAAQGARAGTGIVRGGWDEAAELERARRAQNVAGTPPPAAPSTPSALSGQVDTTDPVVLRARALSSSVDEATARVPRTEVLEVQVPRSLTDDLQRTESAFVPVYSIGGQRVAFGVDPIVAPSVNALHVARNPFKILDIEPSSNVGRAIVSDYAAAVNAVRSSGRSSTDVDALLYMMRQGDTEAAEAFKRLSQMGERPNVAPLRPQGDTSGIVLVHATSRPARLTNGEAILRPAGDWRASPQGLTPMEIIEAYNRNRRTKNFYYPWRDSVHFSLNHRVAPVVGMASTNTWDDAPFFIFSNLSDVIEANPGALSNLARYDTWLIPEVGKGLRLPNATVIEAPRKTGAQRAITRPNADPGFAGETKMRLNDQEYLDLLVKEELGRRGAQAWSNAAEDLSNISPSAPRGAWLRETDQRVNELAETMGVTGGRHFETVYYYGESQPFDLFYNKGRGETFPYFRQDIPVSANFLQRFFARGGHSGVQYGPSTATEQAVQHFNF